MPTIEHRAGVEIAPESADSRAVEARLFRLSCWIVAAIVALSAFWWPWRVTTGLLLGGLLSLFNFHWMKTSIAAAFRPTTEDGSWRPKLPVVRYVLRYFVIALVVFAAHQLNLISLVATLCGLCAFAFAVFFEGLIQMTLAIIHREEY